MAAVVFQIGLGILERAYAANTAVDNLVLRHTDNKTILMVEELQRITKHCCEWSSSSYWDRNNLLSMTTTEWHISQKPSHTAAVGTRQMTLVAVAALSS